MLGEISFEENDYLIAFFLMICIFGIKRSGPNIDM